MSFRTHPRVSFSISFLTSLLNSYITDRKTATRGLTKPGGRLLLLPFHPTWHPTPAPPKPPNPTSRNRIASPLSVQCPPRRHPPQSASTAVQPRVYVSIAGVAGAAFGCLGGSGRQRRLLWIEGKWGRGEARRGEKITMHLTDAMQLRVTFVASVMLETLNFVHQLHMTKG